MESATRDVELRPARLIIRAPSADTPVMSSAAIGGASSQLASVMAAAALEGNQLGLAEAQINASAAAGGGAPAVSSSAQAPGTLEVYA